METIKAAIDDARAVFYVRIMEHMRLEASSIALQQFKTVVFVEEKLGMTLQKHFFTGSAVVIAIEKGGAAEEGGVVVGDEVVALAGGCGSGFPQTELAIGGYDQLMRLYRAVNGRGGRGRPLILTLYTKPAAASADVRAPYNASAEDEDLDEVELYVFETPYDGSVGQQGEAAATPPCFEKQARNPAVGERPSSAFRLNEDVLDKVRDMHEEAAAVLRRQQREVTDRLHEAKAKVTEWIEWTRENIEHDLHTSNPGLIAPIPKSDEDNLEVIRDQARRQWRNQTRAHLERFRGRAPHVSSNPATTRGALCINLAGSHFSFRFFK
jgi:hypothetical protein